MLNVRFHRSSIHNAQTPLRLNIRVKAKSLFFVRFIRSESFSCMRVVSVSHYLFFLSKGTADGITKYRHKALFSQNFLAAFHNLRLGIP